MRAPAVGGRQVWEGTRGHRTCGTRPQGAMSLKPFQGIPSEGLGSHELSIDIYILNMQYNAFVL